MGYVAGTNTFGIFPWNFSGTQGVPTMAFSGSNVGIGTTSPGAKLDIIGDVALHDYPLRLRAPSDYYHQIDYGSIAGLTDVDYWNYNSYLVFSQGTSTPRVTITGSGNVGIGTTSPGYKLDVVGQGSFSDYLYIGGLRLKGTDTTNTIYQSNSGSNLYITANGGNIGLGQVSATPIVNILASGNVGIGTTDPGTRKLKVAGDIEATGNIYGTMSGTVPAAQVSAGTFGANVGNGNFTFPANLYINGNVGIGTTSPGAKLHVTGSSGYASENGPLMVTDATTPAKKVSIGYDTTYDAGFVSALYSGVAWKNLILQGGGGNVGIGTTSPGAKLEVNGTGKFWAGTGNGSIAIVSPGASNNTGYIEWRSGPSNTRLGYMGGDSSSYLNITLENSANLAITGGNVGIGTTSPGAKLDVAGPARISQYHQSYWAAMSPSGTYARLAAMDTANSVSQAVLSTNGWVSSSDNSLNQDNATLPTWFITLDAGASASGWDGLRIKRAPAGSTNAANLTTLFAINNQGNVGIGTTAPGYKLEVAGSFKSSSGGGNMIQDTSGNVIIEL